MAGGPVLDEHVEGGLGLWEQDGTPRRAEQSRAERGELAQAPVLWWLSRPAGRPGALWAERW